MSFLLVKNGVFDTEGITKILSTPVDTGEPLVAGEVKPTGTRNLKYNISDLKAQVLFQILYIYCTYLSSENVTVTQYSFCALIVPSLCTYV